MSLGAPPAGRRRTLSPALVGAGVGALAAVLALGPVLAERGFVLSYDLVAVPDPPLGRAALGLDGNVPRSVPTDALVSVLSTVMPADLVQHLFLLGIFVLAGAGAGRSMPTRVGAAAAALAVVWNAFVLERLVLGHWAFLMGLAVLPWAAAAAARARTGQPGALLSTCLWVFVAGLFGSTALVTVLGTVLLVTLWPGTARQPGGARRAAALSGVGLCVAAPWLLPGLVVASGSRSAAEGVPAFASRADSPLGVWGSLVSLGGVWNPAVWPPERQHWMVAMGTVLLVVLVVALGGRALVRSQDTAGSALAVAAGVGLLLAGGAHLPGGAAVLRWSVVHLPGGGLLRDGQKFLAPLVLAVALCVGFAVERVLQADVAGRLGRPAARLIAVTLACLPVLLLPSQALGLGHRVSAVAYPAEWTEVQQLLAGAPAGDAASFPWTYYRRYTWNDDRVVLDPVPRLLRRTVLANDALPLLGGSVAGENPRAARVTRAWDEGTDLSEALRVEGVRYVVVHRPATGADQVVERLAGEPVLHEGPELLVLDLGPVGAPTDRPPGWLAVGWVLLLGCGTVLVGLGIGAWFHAAARGRLLTSGEPVGRRQDS